MNPLFNQQQQPHNYMQQQQQPYQNMNNQTNNIFANPQNPNIFAQQGGQQSNTNIFANQNNQMWQQQPNQQQQQQQYQQPNIFNQNQQMQQQQTAQFFQNNNTQQQQQYQQQYSNNNNNIFNQPQQQNTNGGMQNVFANSQNNAQRNIFQSQNTPNNMNIFAQQQQQQPQNQNIFAQQNQYQQQPQNNTQFINPIIKNRMQQQTHNSINPQQQGSIFNNNNTNIFANQNQNQIIGQNNNNMNRSIFSNNAATPNIFNNQTPNNMNGTNNLFRSNVGGITDPNRSIFSNNNNNNGNIFSTANNNPVNIFQSSNNINNNILPNNSIFNRQVQHLNPVGQLQNGKIILPPPKKYQTKRLSDNLIDPDGWVGAYLQFKDDGKVIKLGKEKVEEIQGYLSIRPPKELESQQKSKGGMIDEVNGDFESTYDTSNPKTTLSTEALLGPLTSLDLNLHRAGESLPHAFSSKYINNPRPSSNYFSTDIHRPLERSTSLTSKSLHHNQTDEQIENQKRFELLVTRQNMYYDQKPMQPLISELSSGRSLNDPSISLYPFSSRMTGILKKQSIAMPSSSSKLNLNDSFEEGTNLNRMRQQYLLNSSSNATRSALITKGTLSMTQSLSGGFDHNKNHRFIHEMEKDPRNEMYRPRRIERLLVSAAQDMSVDQDESISQTAGEQRSLDENINPLGLKPAVQLTEMLRDSKDITRSKSDGVLPIVKGFDTLFTKDFDVEIVCHVTNVSTKKTEKEVFSNTRISTVQQLDVLVKNVFDIACRRTGLIWHRDFDECLRRSVIYFDENQKVMAFQDYTKSLRDLGISKHGSFEVEFYISEAPILKVSKDDLQCDPPIEELQKWSVEELQNVKSFYVQNQHGSIEFDGCVDLTRQNLNEIILIEQRKAHVYPEHIFAGRTPKKGMKLNQSAMVTLFCIDETIIGRALQGEQSFYELESKLKRQTVKNQTEFIKLDPHSGHFSFRVFDWSC